MNFKKEVALLSSLVSSTHHTAIARESSFVYSYGRLKRKEEERERETQRERERLTVVAVLWWRRSGSSSAAWWLSLELLLIDCSWWIEQIESFMVAT
jgi:hypothetical protein